MPYARDAPCDQLAYPNRSSPCRAEESSASGRHRRTQSCVVHRGHTALVGVPGHSPDRSRSLRGGRYHRDMRSRAVPARLPVLAQDALLALVVTGMQVQGTLTAAQNSEVASRPLTDLGNLGFILLVGSGLVLALRRRWPVSVFVTTALASLVYFTAGFSDGPGWIALFIALYTLTAYGDGRRSLAIAGVGIGVLATSWLIL